MTKTPLLSALVVAHNEEENLSACLATLSFADEIVVVLDRCTDQSRNIALVVGARLIEGAWDIEGPRRTAGQEACQGKWIFEVDADERVSDALAKEIKETLAMREKRDEGPDWWRIPFDNYVGKRLVRQGWGAQFGVGAKAILYRRGIKSWGNQRVHPKVALGGTSGKTLENRMDHLVDKNISDMIQRLDRYTTAHALDMINEGDTSTYGKNVARIFGRFYKCFILRKGYNEGGIGLVIAIFAGLYPFLSYIKTEELRKK